MTEPSLQDQLVRLLGGNAQTQMLYVAAKLGLADLLVERPRTADELAVDAKTGPRPLYRLLRGLASLGIFAEDDQHRFTLTPLAECLRSDVPGSVRSLAIVRGEWQYAAWGQLLHSVHTGQCAFEKVGTERQNRASFEREQRATGDHCLGAACAARTRTQHGTLMKARRQGWPGVVG